MYFCKTVNVPAGIMAIALCGLGAAVRSADAQDVTSVDMRGIATFDVGTNISAISVHGKSSAVEGRAELRDTGQGLTIEHVDLSVPVNSLETGMGVRDSHMRKYIFTTSDGQTPDVKFDASNVSCPSNSGGNLTCQVTGDLVIRGLPRPFAMTMKVKKDGASYHAAGDSIVKLSLWNIERPSQLGVQTTDDVKLHLEFTAKPVATQTATAAANRSDR
jgi:polyisoprenoid-binding protein YceI